MYKLSTFLILTTMTLIGVASCSKQADSPKAPSEPRNNAGGGNAISVEPPVGCVPSAANNNCAPVESMAMVEKCWTTILDNDVAKACSAAGKFYNRLTEKPCDGTTKLAIKVGCTMDDVYSVNASAGYPQATIDAQIANLKTNFQTNLPGSSEPILDQCVQTTTVDGKTFLIPVFLTKKYTGGTDGFGSYEIRAGAVCDYSKTNSKIPSCLDAELAFPSSGSGAQADTKPLSCG